MMGCDERPGALRNTSQKRNKKDEIISVAFAAAVPEELDVVVVFFFCNIKKDQQRTMLKVFHGGKHVLLYH